MDTIEDLEMKRYVVKAFLSQAYQYKSKYGVLDCEKDTWVTYRHFATGPSTTKTFQHQESAQYYADKLNKEESESD